MTRRAVTWAATSVPDVRRQWANAMTSVVNRTTEELLGPPPPGSSPAMVKQLQRIQQKMAGDAEAMTAEASALRTADMYWVHRDMVDVAAAAATTLPACYVTTVGRHVIYESRLELARLLFADFDRSVHRICAQPFLLVTRSHGRMMKIIP